MERVGNTSGLFFSLSIRISNDKEELLKSMVHLMELKKRVYDMMRYDMIHMMCLMFVLVVERAWACGDLNSF